MRYYTEHKHLSHFWQHKHFRRAFQASGLHQIQHQKHTQFLISDFTQLTKTILSDKFLYTFYKHSQKAKSLQKES